MFTSIVVSEYSTETHSISTVPMLRCKITSDCTAVQSRVVVTSEPIICKPYVPRAGSPGNRKVPRAASPQYFSVPRAGSPGYIFVLRAGSPVYIFVLRAGSPNVPSCN